MKVPESFLQDLKTIDKRFDCKFDKSICRWVVFQNGRGLESLGKVDGINLFTMRKKPFTIMTIQNEDGSYRPPDKRTIHDLAENLLDRRYGRSPKKQIEGVIAYNKSLMKEKIKKLADDAGDAWEQAITPDVITNISNNPISKKGK